MLSDSLSKLEEDIEHYLTGDWADFYSQETKAKALNIARIVRELREELDRPPTQEDLDKYLEREAGRK